MVIVNAGRPSYTLIDPIISTAAVDTIEGTHPRRRAAARGQRPLLPRSVVTNAPLIAFDVLLSVALLLSAFSATLWVSQAYVDEGPTLKRFRPRAQGRAYRIRKRTSHITVEVESRPKAEPKKAAAKGRKSSAKRSAS